MRPIAQLSLLQRLLTPCQAVKGVVCRSERRSAGSQCMWGAQLGSAPTSVMPLGVLHTAKQHEGSGWQPSSCTTANLYRPLGCNHLQQLSLCQMLVLLPQCHLQMA